MAASLRKSFSENINISLVSEVNSRCPKCNAALMHAKAKTVTKNYEIAHIYPVNPRAHEEELLKHEERLSEDVNHTNNLIALCLPCHNIFDNPRTIEEYRELLAIKKAILEKKAQIKLVDEYQIETEISQIISALEADEFSADEDLSLDPKSLDEKIDKSMTRLTRSRIEQNVTSYFAFIRTKLRLIEASSPQASERISIQIRLFYLQQAKTSSSQQQIYKNIVYWLQQKTSSTSSEACEILASFFIQNCEIFK
ncbi:ABC-three component system protein [Pseudomonas aeruginosa]